MSLSHRCAVTTLAAVLAMAATPALAVTAPPPTPAPAAATATATQAPPTPRPTSTIGGERLLKPGILVDRPAGVLKPPEMHAASYVVADANDGRVILAKEAHVQARPASTMKALTALTLAPRLSPTTTVVATPEDAAIDGTKVGLVPGEEYTVRQLLLGLLLSSGNDAANALGRANGGIPATAAQMTEYAHSIGALDTFAKNPSGLDATGQLTSAYDLALLGRAAIADPDVAPYLTVKTAELPGKRTAGKGSRRERYRISSHNRLLWNYEGMIGVKNGYTQAAKQTYIGAARRGDQAYVITYLGGESVGWRDAAALLDWAFAHGQKVRPLGQLVDADTFDAAATAPVAPVEPEATDAPTAASAGGVDLTAGDTPGRLALLAGGGAALVAAGAFGWSRLRRRAL